MNTQKPLDKSLSQVGRKIYLSLKQLYMLQVNAQ